MYIFDESIDIMTLYPSIFQPASSKNKSISLHNNTLIPSFYPENQ